MTDLLIKKLIDDVDVPKYMTDGAVAFDISAAKDYTVFGDVVKVQTGIAVEVPKGFELNIRARSGLSVKYPNYIVITGGGTIDQDYRGELLVAVVNRSKLRWGIKKGDRIAQGILHPVEICDIKVVDELSETNRGSGGYGHTGE
jgi:dUTP pyrophosphatase